MSGTAKKVISSDFWSLQNAFVATNELKKDFTSVFKEALLDPFSVESLEQFQIIESLLIETHYHTGFSKEEENNLFSALLEKLKHSKSFSLTIIKRNWSQVLTKRKILPKECFKKGKFIATLYKKHLFKELSSKIPQTTSILSLCYHFAQELQAETAILCGEFCDLESTTLEFLTYVEHLNRQFKYPALLIHEPYILQGVLNVLHHHPLMSSTQLESLLTDCVQNANSLDPTMMACSILSLSDKGPLHPFRFKLLDRLDLISLISFFSHFEELLKIFKGREQKILELCQHYQNSLSQDSLFFEDVTFHEIPLIVDTLMTTLSLENQESNSYIIEEIHHLIWAYKENPKFLIQFLQSKKTGFYPFANPFTAFLPNGVKAVKDLLFLIETFSAFKTLSIKKDWKKMVKALSNERHLCIYRIPSEQVKLALVKEMKGFFIDTKPTKEGVTDYLQSFDCPITASDYLETFYPLLV